MDIFKEKIKSKDLGDVTGLILSLTYGFKCIRFLAREKPHIRTLGFLQHLENQSLIKDKLVKNFDG